MLTFLRAYQHAYAYNIYTLVVQVLVTVEIVALAVGFQTDQSDEFVHFHLSQ